MTEQLIRPGEQVKPPVAEAWVFAPNGAKTQALAARA